MATSACLPACCPPRPQPHQSAHSCLPTTPFTPSFALQLADFGIARMSAVTLCTENPEAGTAPYLAPELMVLDNYTVTEKVGGWIDGFGAIAEAAIDAASAYRSCTCICI